MISLKHINRQHYFTSQKSDSDCGRHINIRFNGYKSVTIANIRTRVILRTKHNVVPVPYQKSTTVNEPCFSGVDLWFNHMVNYGKQ